MSDSHHPYCSGESLLGHDVVEVVHGDGVILVGVGSVDHLLQLLVGHGLAELSGDTTEITESDGAGAIVIEKSENFGDVLAGVFVTHAGGHHIEELFKINVTTLVLVEVSDHLVDSLVLCLEAE